MSIHEPTPFIRADGPSKVTGSGRYTADLSSNQMLYAKFRYAGMAHARIRRLDTSAAQAIPGVIAVITQDDVPDVRYSYGLADRTLFATGTVRFEGEVVAAVAALSPEIAQQAADAIDLDLEPLPIVGDIEQAMRPGSGLVHEGWQNYEITGDTTPDRNIVTFSALSKGDVEAALATADVVVTERFEADGSHAVPIEPRAVVAEWQGDKVTIWSSTQVPFDTRDGVAETLQLPSNRVRVIVPHLGGGFGGKCGVHFEPHVAALARAAHRPVKLVFSRAEEFTAPDRRRESMIVEITTGLNSDGHIVGRQAEVTIDNGAYVADAAFFPQLAAMHVAGPYKIPALHIGANLVYTNHQPSGSVRAPTAPQACWAVETHSDSLARAIGLDPVEFRRRNLVDTGDEGPVGQIYDEIGVLRCLESAVASAVAAHPEIGAVGNVVDVDDGIASYRETLGVAVGWWPSFAAPVGAFAKMQSDGTVQVITGAQECGTGAVMTLRKLAADELGISETDVSLVYQDTAAAPTGPGATGSQTLLNHGRAVERAAIQIAEQLKELAATELEASAADIVLANGLASVTGTPSASIALTELAATAAGGDLLLGGASAPMPEHPTIPGSACVGDHGVGAWLAPQFSCHVARVAIDDDTGVARVLDVHAAHDAGTIINPMGAHGQVEGGVLMGVGQALTEVTHYGPDGRQINTALTDYKLQTAADAPKIHTTFIEIPTENAGPRGSKGLAEAPNVPTAAAISNAIAGAIGRPVAKLPMTAERILDAKNNLDGGDQ